MTENCILSDYYYVPKTRITNVAKVKADLTVSPIWFNKNEPKPEPIVTYRVTSKYIGMPVWYGMQNFPDNEHSNVLSIGQPLIAPKRPDPYHENASPNQDIFMQDLIDYYDDEYIGLALAGTGTGKCLEPNEPVLMYDGSIKKTKYLKVGDLLMGASSDPKEVLTVCRGFGELYRITPVKGKSWVCNKDHILSLKHTQSGVVTTVSLLEWQRWGSKKKHLHKLYRVAVDFPERQQPILSSYFMGVVLGDGSIKKGGSIAVTSIDKEIINECYAQANKFMLCLRKEDITYHFSQTGRADGNYAGNNQLVNIFRNYGLQAGVDKFIPDSYKLGSRDIRLGVLAGLIDTDGSLSTGCYDYISKSRRLSDDVAFVARSVGLAAYVKEVRKECTNNGVWGTYWRVCISGHINIIPCKLPRKQAQKRRQKKDVLRTGFSVESIGVGEYFGITLGGDHLYLLDDFTVTHNTVAALNLAAELGVSTLVITDREFLGFEQWIPEAKDKIGLVDSQIGIIQGDRCEYDRPFCVAMGRSLTMRDYPKELYTAFGLVIWDELHKFGARELSKTFGLFKAQNRLGLTATPKRGDGAQAVFLNYFGRGQIKAKSDALACRVLVKEYVASNPPTGQHAFRIKAICADVKRNMLIVDRLIDWYNKGHHILVVGDNIKHLQRLEELCWKQGVPETHTGQFSRSRYVYINEPRVCRRTGKKITVKLQKTATMSNEYLNWVKKSARLVFSTYGMIKEGIDIPRLDRGIDITPRRDGIQILGRIRRPLPDKGLPVWLTIRDSSSEPLVRIAGERIRDYKTSKSVEVIDNGRL